MGGRVDAGADRGRNGLWLLDPHDVEISTGGDPNSVNFTANADDFVVNNASLTAALAGGTDVTVSTGTTGTQNGDIAVKASVTPAVGGTPRTLTLSAAGNITVDPNIEIAASTGSLNVELLAGSNNNAISMTATSKINTGLGGDLKAVATGKVELGILTVGGKLSVTAGDDITQSGVLTVTGISTFRIDTGIDKSVLLAVAGLDNDLQGVVTIGTVNGGTLQDIGLRNVNAGAAVPSLPATLRNLDLQFTAAPVQVPTTALTGTLNVLAGGAITQTASGVQVTGASTFNAGGNAITLADSANDFKGAVSASNSGANAIQLTDANAIKLGTVTTQNNLTVIAGDDITQSGVLTVAGTSTFRIDTGTNKSILLAAAGLDNDLQGVVTIDTVNGGTLQDVGLRNVNAGAAVPSLPATLRNLDLQFTTAPIQVPTIALSGTLNVLAGGAITQAASGVQVTGASTFNAGGNAITLADPANDFKGAVSASNSGANATQLRDANAIQLGTVT